MNDQMIGLRSKKVPLHSMMKKTVHRASARASHLLRGNRARGFTLIEILVVVTLSIVLMTAAAGLFFTTLISNTKKNVISVVKDEGDYASSQIEFLLRNAVSLVPDPLVANAPTCTTSMTSISFRSLDDGITTLTTLNNRIASQSATTGTPVYLTSDSVQVSQPLVFDCQQSSTNFGSYIKLSFQLQKDSPDVDVPQPVTEKFETSVQVRNF